MYYLTYFEFTIYRFTVVPNGFVLVVRFIPGLISICLKHLVSLNHSCNPDVFLHFYSHKPETFVYRGQNISLRHIFIKSPFTMLASKILTMLVPMHPDAPTFIISICLMRDNFTRQRTTCSVIA